MTIKKKRKKVAWLVEDWQGDHENYGHSIVFNNHGLAARRIGACQLGLEFDDVTCRRMPVFDKYSNRSYVPPIAYLENSWWLVCNNHSCQEHVSDDTHDINYIVIKGESIWCSHTCYRDDMISKICTEKKFINFKKEVIEKRPDLTFIEFTGGYPYITLSGKFTFPGCEIGGSVRDQEGDGKIGWTVAQYDLEKWNEYNEKVKEEQNEQRETTNI